MPNRKNVPAFSPFLYRYRNLVERFFNKLKHFRAVATRFEKHDANYLALVKLAAATNLDAIYELVTSPALNASPEPVCAARATRSTPNLPNPWTLGWRVRLARSQAAR